MMLRIRKSLNGFTLIELLTVLSIIVLLIVVAFVSFTQARQKARDSRGKSDLREMVNAFELKYNDQNFYPAVPPTGSSCGTGLCGQPIPPGDTSLAPYLSPTPHTNGLRKYYWYDDGASNPQKFCIYFQLEISPSQYFSCSHKGCQIATTTTCLGF